MITSRPFSVTRGQWLKDGSLRFTVIIHTSVGLIPIHGWRLKGDRVYPPSLDYMPLVSPLPKTAKVELYKLAVRLRNSVQRNPIPSESESASNGA